MRVIIILLSIALVNAFVLQPCKPKGGIYYETINTEICPNLESCLNLYCQWVDKYAGIIWSHPSYDEIDKLISNNISAVITNCNYVNSNIYACPIKGQTVCQNLTECLNDYDHHQQQGPYVLWQPLSYC